MWANVGNERIGNQDEDVILVTATLKGVKEQYEVSTLK